MRALPIAGITSALLSLGCSVGPQPISPFNLFERPDMAPGIEYAVMDESAKRESIGRFTCKPLWAGGKRCQVAIDPGMLIATVNGKGRVVHLKVATEPLMRGFQWDPRTAARVDFAKSEFIRMREAWSVANPAEVTTKARGTAEFHWVDDQSRWKGGMWYGSYYATLTGDARRMEQYRDTLASLPDSVVSTDEFGLEEYLKLEPADGGRSAGKGPPSDPLERMQFDLAMVVSAQAEYFEDHATYAAKPDGLIFLAGDGVHIEIRDATRTGWAAVATHDAIPGMTCVVYAGSVPTPPRTPRGVNPAGGQVACDRSS